MEFPANQICTDDFTGPLANNTNLGAKGIIALAAFGALCVYANAELEVGTNCSHYTVLSQEFSSTWMRHAFTPDPAPHYKMSFNDLPGIADSWSLKYNLVWQKLLGLGQSPFPVDQVAALEVTYYARRRKEFGTPLDPRHNYTKADWLSWAAALAASDADFEQLFDPIYDYANATPSRLPLADLYNTDDARDSARGMYNRPVVGAFFARALLRQREQG